MMTYGGFTSKATYAKEAFLPQHKTLPCARMHRWHACAWDGRGIRFSGQAGSQIHIASIQRWGQVGGAAGAQGAWAHMKKLRARRFSNRPMSGERSAS